MITVRRFAAGERVVLATHNRGKIAELRAMLAPAGLEVTDAAALGLTAPAEPADDFAGNASAKAVAVARTTGFPALADDSGFVVAALGGAPGVLSARWAGASGDFRAAMERVRDMVRDMAKSSPDHGACFICALAVAWPDGTTAHFTGRIDGSWTWPPRGRLGFGYDPMFVPSGETRTFAEMAPAEKAGASHRARAFAAFAEACLP